MADIYVPEGARRYIESEPDTFRTALIGTGGISRAVHVGAVTRNPRTTLVGAASLDPVTGRSLADDFGVPWFGSVEEMAETVRPDISIVGTPTGTHAEPTITLAQNGSAVLVEKPLELNAERAALIVDAAREHDVTIGAIFQGRYKPAIRTIHDAIARGEFGSSISLSLRVPWYRDDAYYQSWRNNPELDGGAMCNQGVHYLDMAVWFSSAACRMDDPHPVDAVKAISTVIGHDQNFLKVPDRVVAQLAFKNGSEAVIDASTAEYKAESPTEIQILGANGHRATIRDDKLVLWEDEKGKIIHEDLLDDAGHRHERAGAVDPLSISEVYHEACIDDFINAVTEGCPAPITAEEAYRTVEVLDEIEKAAAAGFRFL